MTAPLIYASRARDRANAAATDAVDLAQEGRFADALDAVTDAERHLVTLRISVQEARATAGSTR